MNEFTRYLLVGGSGTAVDVLVFTVLILLGVDKIIANVTGFIVGTGLVFIIHNKWTFKNRTDQPYKNLIRFLTVNITGLLLSSLLILFLVDVVGVPVLLTKIIVVVAVGLTIYLVNSRWSFR